MAELFPDSCSLFKAGICVVVMTVLIHPNPFIAMVWSHGTTHSSLISMPKPGASEGVMWPSLGMGMPGMGQTSSRGTPGSEPIQNSAIGDSGIAMPKRLP